MKKIQRIGMLIMSIFIITSCSDQLEVDPTSVITSNSFWKTEGDAQGALVGMYVNLRTIASRNLYYVGEARADILQLGTVGSGGWDKYYNHLLTPDNAGPSWQSFYTLINSANLIIKYVPEIEFTDDANKNLILAQAYAMRAYTYFVMSKTWGDLIIRTEPVEGVSAEITIKEREPVENVFSLIKSDIDTSLDLFPDNTFASGRTMWSKPSVNALKGEVYLWTAKQLGGGATDLNTALTALEEIETADVALVTDYSDIFNYDNKANEEILMSVKFAQYETGDNYFADMYLIQSALPSDITSETQDFLLPIGGNNITVPTDSFKDSFSTDDSRKDATFFEIYLNDGSYYTTVNVKGRGTVVSGSRLFLDDYILFRYADVLLMKAEAKNGLGQDPSAEMNMIRQRAYGDAFAAHVFVNGSAEENDAAILEERKLEFGFEGKRWWDLVRFDKAVEMLPGLAALDDPEGKILFPISTSVLSLEPLVEQNPAYQAN
ncbi:hypothetical protein OKW21_004201 [Catalinimonas alkaloidigena]|uniref:RagB/SusD family nutrient uptake outer membrane protein n=1 Tax=Catalinimonas alkaloidigena TaxID=1075417 RepID=UPI002405CDED|nr:RagB/SusD family nutrient uptake outer membrane protein [Catalinimonas alkaloidigena]MDF9798938.1 hypothetical protein [Catalinimonas alkaloidigena]